MIVTPPHLRHVGGGGLDPPRGFNARERRRFAPRRQKPYGNFRDALDRRQDGGEYCPSGKAHAAAAVIECAVELDRRP
jgi:hypothetical protein